MKALDITEFSFMSLKLFKIHEFFLSFFQQSKSISKSFLNFVFNINTLKMLQKQMEWNKSYKRKYLTFDAF